MLALFDHDCGGISVEPVDGKEESGDGISKEGGPFKVTNSSEQITIQSLSN
jgi:alkaline phosphatase